MNKVTCFLLLVFSLSVFAQKFELISQDKGKVIVHDSCNTWLRDDNNWYRSSDFLSRYKKYIDELARKGYRAKIVKGDSSEILLKDEMLIDIGKISGAGNQKWSWARSLKLYINQDKDYEFILGDNFVKVEDLTIVQDKIESSVFTKRPIVMGQQYDDRNVWRSSKAEAALLEVINKLPNCITHDQSSGVVSYDNDLDLSTKEYELNACVNIYEHELKKLENKLKGESKKLFFTGGLMVMAGGALLPPLYWVGAGLIFYGNGNIFGAMADAAKKNKLRDGRSIIEVVISCERKQVKGKNCDYEKYIILENNNLKKKTRKYFSKIIANMGMEEFSRQISNSIANNRTCSNTNKKLKELYIKNITKEAKRNF